MYNILYLIKTKINTFASLSLLNFALLSNDFAANEILLVGCGKFFSVLAFISGQ